MAGFLFYPPADAAQDVVSFQARQVLGDRLTLFQRCPGDEPFDARLLVRKLRNPGSLRFEGCEIRLALNEHHRLDRQRGRGDPILL